MTADTSRRDRSRPWVVAAALAGAAAAWNAWSRQGHVFGPLDDETLLVPIALRRTGLAEFAGDRWLATTAPVFSVPYSWILGPLLRLVDDPVRAMRLLALVLHVVFLAGTWRLAERLAGRAAAAAAVLLVALPPFAALVFAPGAALPRDLVFALVPWFVLGADAARERGPGAGIALWLGVGVAANLHPLTALHAAMWLLLLELVRDPSAKGLIGLAARGVACGAGAAPYVVQYLSRPAAAGVVDETAYAWRLGSMAGETWGPWALRMEPLLWIAAAAALVAFAVRRDFPPIPRWLAAGVAVAAVVAAAGPTLGRFVPSLREFQFDRFGRLAAWSAAVLLATGGVVAWRARRFAWLAASAALVAVALLGPDLLRDASGRGPIARAGRGIDRRMGVSFARRVPSRLIVTGAADPSSPRFRDDFLAVCRHVRERSAPDDLFLVPPEQWGPFRAYTWRPVAVTRKEGGAAMSFLGKAGMDWFDDYADAVRVYRAGGPAGWERLAARWGARWAVVDATTTPHPGWPAVFEAGNFRVLDARGK